MSTTNKITETDLRDALYDAKVTLISDGPHTLVFLPGFAKFEIRTNGKFVASCNQEYPLAVRLFNDAVAGRRSA